MNSRFSIHLLVLSVILIIQACGGDNGENERGSRFNRGGDNQQNRGTSVETVTIESTDISKKIKSFGTVAAKDVINITPLVSEAISRIYVDIGDTVSQGQVLAQIKKKAFQEQVEQARSQVRQRRAALERDSAEFERQKKLYNQQLVSSTAFEQAKATYLDSQSQLESAKSSLDESLENLNNTTIRSPVNGVIVSRPLSQGDIATTGTTIFEIANTVGYETRVFLPLKDWKLARVGQEVTFRASNESGIAARGRVSRINPRLDPTTGLGEVIIALTERGPSIFQGVLVEAAINVETHTNTVAVPRSALVENIQTVIEPESNSIQLERSYSAFVVKNDTLAEKRKLTLGIEQGDRVEVLEGLNPGEELIITGQDGLADQAKVRIADSDQFQSPEEQQIEQTVSETKPEAKTAADTTKRTGETNSSTTESPTN